MFTIRVTSKGAVITPHAPFLKKLQDVEIVCLKLGPLVKEAAAVADSVNKLLERLSDEEKPS